MIEITGTTPVAAVDYVFKVMFATYGSAWSRAIGDAPIADVKTVWGEVLNDYMGSDEAKRPIMWALNNLPDTVPNSRQFRSLCRNAPSKAPVMLPAPVVNPEIAARVIEGLKAQPVGKVDHKAWARRIIARAKSGERVSPTVLQMAHHPVGVSA